ncbi:MAG: hypothetical protein M0R76_00510 [Proteobacteria bacterium]|nr:hypothetical protein [Pseudomonadota bacterium]
MQHKRSHPIRLVSLLLMLALGSAGCAEILTDRQFIETTAATEVKTIVTEEPTLHLSTTSGPDDGSALAFRLTKYGECQEVELRTVHQTEVITRTMTQKDKVATAVFYSLGIVGAGLLATGIAIDGDYTRKKSETEMQKAQEDASDTTFTGKGYLVLSGAVLTPFFIGGIANSAQARDSKKNLGTRVDQTVRSEGRCNESVPSISEVIFFAPAIENELEIALRTVPDADGNLLLPRAEMAETLCGNDERSSFRARYAEGTSLAREMDVTDAILPVCNEIRAERQAAYEAEKARQAEEARRKAEAVAAIVEARRRRIEAEAAAAAAEAERIRIEEEAEAAARQQARWDRANPHIDAGMRAVENRRVQEAKQASAKATSIAPDNPRLSYLDDAIYALERQIAQEKAERQRQAEVRKKKANVQNYIQQCKVAAKRYTAARETQARAAVAGNPAMVDKAAREMEIASDKFSNAAANIRMIIQIYNDEGKRDAASAVREAGRPCLGR